MGVEQAESPKGARALASIFVFVGLLVVLGLVTGVEDDKMSECEWLWYEVGGMGRYADSVEEFCANYEDGEDRR